MLRVLLRLIFRHFGALLAIAIGLIAGLMIAGYIARMTRIPILLFLAMIIAIALAVIPPIKQYWDNLFKS